ncbi:SDR family oxidoreductase [Nocardioides sp. QY071]|uniref:SDR family oxidoreductase n=1 Tax=Nocardioides sp. QY071 TaxID=3044187 RepID=UPI00249BF7F3|nr:SDR family oxidoreductase [Nocardioides sp. QY071]WGY01695.1 SDR family oxidoreductase [Nocardioides sp. QY071]
MAYVVTGATGGVGRFVAEELSRRGAEPVRLIVRDADRAAQIPGAEVVEAEWDDAAALEKALREGDRVFMVSLPQSPDERTRLQGSFIDAAAKAGVERIVYLSFMLPSPTAIFHHARSHHTAEEALRASGVPWVFIRNGMYSDHLPGWFDEDGICRVPVGDGRISFSYRRELAEAIAITMMEDGHLNKIYDVTGSEALTMDEIAECASSVSGDTYTYQPASIDHWLGEYAKEDLNQDQITWRLSEFEAQERGELAVVSDDYRKLTGKDPLTVRQILERHVDDLPLSGRHD